MSCTTSTVTLSSKGDVQSYSNDGLPYYSDGLEMSDDEPMKCDASLGDGSPGSQGEVIQQAEDTVEQGEVEPKDRSTLPVTRRPGHLKRSMTHSEARGATCILCWEKSDLIVSAKLAAVIKEFSHHSVYDLDNLSHPSGICNACKRYLYMVKAGSVGRRTDPRIKWKKKVLSTIVIPDTAAPTEECVLSGCPICSLARFNPVGKTGPKCVVNHPVMDPVTLVMEAEVQPTVEQHSGMVKQEMSCRTCATPIGPGLPHPHCPQNQSARRKAGKVKQKKEARERRQEQEAVIVHEEEALRRGVENSAEGRYRMKQDAVRRRDIIRDRLLQESIKTQEQIMCDMLLRTGAAKGVQESFRLELTRPQGGRPLEVHYNYSYCHCNVVPC